jgi:glycosyltransferase involved in cell wall biosynthesis
MKIIYVANEYPGITPNFGGIAVVIKNEIEYLIKNGYWVELILVVHDAVNRENLDKNIIIFNWEKKGMFRGLHTRFKLLNYVNQNYKKNDVVNCTDYFGLLPFWIRPRKIVHLHGSLSLNAIGQKKRISLVSFFLEYMTILSSDKIRGVSKSVINLTNYYFPFTKKIKAEVIYNGITYNDINLDNRSTIHGIKNIVFLGKLSKLKGVHFLSDIINFVHEKSLNVQFTIIGQEETRLAVSQKNRLQNEIRNRSLVKFSTRIPNSEVQGLFQKTDLLILPSMTEALPMVVIEAMSQGCPTVAFNVGGLNEMIVDFENGFLIDPYDIEMFVNRINLIITGDLSVKNINKTTREIFLAKFTLDKSMEKLSTFYN